MELESPTTGLRLEEFMRFFLHIWNIKSCRLVFAPKLLLHIMNISLAIHNRERMQPKMQTFLNVAKIALANAK